MQRLQREHIDPLQSEVEQVNALAQSLIQSAPLGVATDAVEAQFEEVNDAWGKLNEQVRVYKCLNVHHHIYMINFSLFLSW